MTIKTKGIASEIDKEIGLRLRGLRKNKGMSQEELGKACKITFQQLQKYESGKNRIAAGRLIQIAKALDVPVWFLFPEEHHTDGGKLSEQLDAQRQEINDLKALMLGTAGNLQRAAK